MSRYTGPRLKLVRALGTALPGLTSKTTERNYPPGQHGQRQRKKSDYGIKLMEKQKLRFNYGVTETQIRRLMSEAKASREQAGKKLLELLERRIDNAVFRAGFAPTIVAARQLVRHKHVLLNGKIKRLVVSGGAETAISCTEGNIVAGQNYAISPLVRAACDE